MNKCITCQKSTTNPKFCSRSCAAKTLNKTSPKRSRPDNFCRRCGTQIPKGRITLCSNCNTNIIDYTKVTIKDLQDRRKGFINSQIRDLAVASVKKTRKWVCEQCGYAKHTHICHIRPISSFPKNTLITTVNHPSNLRELCPNCHWELDHLK